MPTINGTAGNDSIGGTAGDDIIDGLGGNDTINGGDGNDELYGGLGADIVNGGAGNDVLVVLSNDVSSGDQMSGGDGYDTARFHGGNSILDITAVTLNSDIEAIEGYSPGVRLTSAQLNQFSSIWGYFTVEGTATLDLTGNRFKGGGLFLGSGNDNVTMAGNTLGNGVTIWGNGGDDIIIGTEGNDSIQGGDGNDTVEGRGGNDYIDGGTGNDTMLGGDGNDTFFKGFGTDIMDGGAGDDLFLVSIAEGFDADDQVIGGAGVDTLNIEQSGIYQGWQDFSQYQISGIEIFQGGNASFTMTVEQAMQFQSLQLGGLQLANAGTVTFGSSFNVHDFLLSAFGNTVDISAGGNQEFRVIGGAGNDTVFGSGGNDELRGGGGNDELHGGGSSDELIGGAGVDWLDGGSGNDYFYIVAGETVSAGDRFTGGTGTDNLLVGYDPDGSWDSSGTIFDLSAAIIDPGMENLQGNAVRLTVEQISSFSLIGTQSLYLANGGAVDFSNIAHAGNLYLSDSGNHVTASNVIANNGIFAYGGAGNDTIIGSAQAMHDELRGGGGNDTLFGGGGDDFIDGGTGADAMDGGTGNDGYFVDDAGDTVSEINGSGNDSVQSSVSFTLSAGIEDLGLSGAASINATGNALNNRLGGNSGNNLLNGGAGADTMVGGNGNDTYIVDNAGDIADEWGYDGTDLVQSSVTYTIPTFVENLTLTGTAAINGTGSDFANTITGNVAVNILSGEFGADILLGGDGNDTLFGGFDNDSLSGQNGDDTLDGGAGNDTLDGGAGTDTASYGSAEFGVTVSLAIAGAQNTGYAGGPGGGTDTLISIENLYGSESGDILTGSVGANVLNGQSGNDTLDGGAGDDTLNGGTGTDNASYASAAGAVTVSLAISGAQNTGAAGSDTLVNIENLVGSGFADTLTGNSGNNSLLGGAGNDALDGGDGADSLDGGVGNDTMNGGAGTDTASYAGSAAGVTVNLAVLTAQNTVGAGSDTLSNIENLIGSVSADTLTGDANANMFEGGAGNDLLNGGGGTDTASYWAALGGVTVNLGTATAQNTVGAGTDTLSNFENLLGSSFNDTLTGNSGANTIEGAGGNDVMNGGTGTDTASYTTAWSGVVVNLSLAGAQDTGGAGTDTLSNFENLTGSTFADTLTGNAGDNLFDGFGGDDSFDGGTGTDTVTYASSVYSPVAVSLALAGVQSTGMGNHTLANIENLIGSAFSDLLEGDGGANVLDGGDGIDTVSYANAAAGVTVSLAIAGAQNTVGAGTDTLVNMEWLTGSAFNDTLTGSAIGQNIVGGAGDDVVTGGAGADWLIGGAGNDSFRDTAAGLTGDTINDFAVGDKIIIADATLEGFTFDLSGNSSGGTLTFNGNWLTVYGSLNGTLVASAAAGGGVELTMVLATAGNDFITGTQSADTIDGLAGNDTMNGLGGNDQLYGNDGDDTIDGGQGDNLLDGGAGNDSLGDGVGNSTLVGGEGNDWLGAGAGIDVLDGGGGNDTLNGGNDADLMTGGSGDDRFEGLKSSLSGDTITDFALGDKIVISDATLAGFTFNLTGNTLTYTGGALTLQGALTGQLVASAAAGGGVQLSLQPIPSATEGDDTLNGTELADEIDGLSGNDTLNGLGGNDLLIGGGGNDALNGGADFDTASYAAAASAVTVSLAVASAQNTFGAGTDTLSSIENLIGSAFNDTLTGNAAANVIEGGSGNDSIDGGGGFDTASYASAASAVTVSLALSGAQNTLGAGADTLISIENLTGSAFADSLTGDAGNNLLTGNGGNDVLNGGSGGDTMAGGEGDDRLYVDNGSDAIVELAGEGDDWAFVLGTYTLTQGVSVETLVALNQSSTDPLVLTGNEFGQSLYGNLGDNYLNGGEGNDYLVGLAGNDNLLGGSGADDMAGGTGNDVYYAGEAGDRIFEGGGEGSDIVVATASFVLTDGAEVETMSADPTAGNINLTGNEYAQSLYGNGGNNILTGMGGSDYLVGGAGNDRYYVDVSDYVGENAGGGDDTIFVASSYILREGNEIETLVAVNQDSLAQVDFTGNEYGQSLYGSQGVNNLDGAAGNDYLVGLGGNDYLVGGAGNDNLAGGIGNDVYSVDSGDQVIEASGEGDDMVVAFQSFALGAGQSIETLSAAESAGAINLAGNALAQSLYGNGAANILTSGGGADYIVGGGGNDIFVLANAPGVSTIGDYAAGDVVDITQFLAVAAGTDLIGGGYLKIVGSQLQVDANGGGDSWTAVGNVSGSGSVMIRYLLGAASTDLSVARSASQSTMMAAAVAAVGMAILPGDDTKAPADTGSQDAPATGSSPAMLTVNASHLVASADVSRPLLADKPHDGADSLPDRLSIVGKEALVADHHPTAPVEAAAPLAALPDADLAAVAAPASQLALAHGIAMPSAELLLAAASVDAGAPHATAEVARVLLDALAGDGAGRPIDTLLDALPANGGPTGIEHLAANLDTGHGPAFTGAAFHPAFALDLLHALAAHPDATAAA